MKLRRLEEALQALPATLDETYERMLTRTTDDDHSDALTVLRWLAFARRPLTMSEIAEACIIDPSGDGVVDVSNRGGIEDVLKILAGLVVVDVDRSDVNDNIGMSDALSSQTTEVQDEHSGFAASFHPVSK